MFWLQGFQKFLAAPNYKKNVEQLSEDRAAGQLFTVSDSDLLITTVSSTSALATTCPSQRLYVLSAPKIQMKTASPILDSLSWKVFAVSPVASREQV